MPTDILFNLRVFQELQSLQKNWYIVLDVLYYDLGSVLDTPNHFFIISEMSLIHKAYWKHTWKESELFQFASKYLFCAIIDKAIETALEPWLPGTPLCCSVSHTCWWDTYSLRMCKDSLRTPCSSTCTKPEVSQQYRAGFAPLLVHSLWPVLGDFSRLRRVENLDASGCIR